MQHQPYRSIEILRKGQPHLVLLDEEDYQRFKHHTWSITKPGYVHLFIQGVGRQGRGIKGPGHYWLLHRAILGLEKGDPRQGDHINGRPLDNRRANLRICSRGENMQNVRASGRTSKHRGVLRTTMLGRFTREKEAAAVAQAFRDEHMPFAVTR